MDIDFEQAAELLGYGDVQWDTDNNCYSGWSTDGEGNHIGEPMFVAWDDKELAQRIELCR